CPWPGRSHRTARTTSRHYRYQNGPPPMFIPGTNPIESTFSTVRLRTKVTRTAALAMVFKLVESAQQRWRAVNAPHLVALVRAGARFEGGQLIERPTERAA
ncbi:IS256 family transposase, partial [Streptomyces sp. NPDC052107]